MDIQLERVKKRLADRDTHLTLSDTAKDLLAEKGFDPVYGARPLKRVIQQFIENPLALEILKGNFPAGSQVRAEAAGDRMTFTRRVKLPSVRPEMVDFGSGQGRSDFATAGAIPSTPSCEGENAGMDRRLQFLDGRDLKLL